MSILEKIFNKKSQENNNQKPDFYQPIGSLFQAYLINTCSRSVYEGNKPNNVNFTTMAKNVQPYTFSQFCEYVGQGYDLSSKGHYNIESMQLYGAYNIINNNKDKQGTFNNLNRETTFEEACNMVSTVYEMSLATSARFQQASQNPDDLELSYSTLTDLRNNLHSTQEKAFTSQPFNREQGDFTSVETISNPRETFISICNNGDANFVYESLNLIVDATQQTQDTMFKMHNDFLHPNFEASMVEE